MSLSILACGLFRDKSIVAESIAEFRSLKESGMVDRIVVSTWHSELRENPKIYQLLIENEVEVLANNEPQIVMPGHLAHQMKSFAVGLELFDNDDVVLKTRFDLAGNNVKKLKAFYDAFSRREVTHDDWPTIFDNKVIIDGGFVFQPFYLNDIVFLGKKSDMSKFVNLDLSMEFFCSETAPEQWFHYAPFKNNFKIIKDLLSVNVGFYHSEEHRNEEFILNALDFEFFRNAMGFYWQLLLQYYTTPTHISSDQTNPADAFFSGQPINALLFSEQLKVPKFKSLDWINDIVRKKDTVELGKYVDKFKQFSEYENYVKSEHYQLDLSQYRDFLKSYLGESRFNTFRLFDKKATQTNFHDLNIRVKNKESGTHVKELETQILQLRRQLVELKN